jgi:hypothetical protein
VIEAKAHFDAPERQVHIRVGGLDGRLYLDLGDETWRAVEIAKSKTWPDSPRALAGRLRRAATFLRKIGIDIGFEREGRARTRMIRITTTGKPASPETQGVQPSASSTPPADQPKPNSGNGFASPGLTNS